MDNATRKANSSATSTSSSSYSAASTNSHSSSNRSHGSSATDAKTPKKCQRDQKLSRSFLHCIGKHLGRHFLHHHHRQRHHSDAMYNSQDDVRSSSTDSFSLSFERGSHADCQLTGSNIELVGGEEQHKTHTASTSTTGSTFSPTLCTFDVNVVDLYDCDDDDDDNDEETATAVELDRIYRCTAHALSTSSRSDDSRDCGSDSDRDSHGNSNCHSDSDADDENAAIDEPDHQRHHQLRNKAAATTASTCKRLHLSRISISSSVSRMLHHFSSTNSMRSLSCSSTPLRCVKEPKQQKAAATSAKATTGSANNRNSSSSNARASASASAAKKKEKKQQSILRPPIHYVYMKGMSGLYSRVPRYSVCCPYAMQQIA